MKDIKFRAWNKTREEMINNPTEINWINGVPKPVDTNWDWYRSEWILLQYTGFKDVDGVEIYEGDILSKDLHWGIRIEFKKGCFMVRDLDNVRYTNKCLDVPICNFDVSNWEVAGNIYENSELLSN